MKHFFTLFLIIFVVFFSVVMLFSGSTKGSYCIRCGEEVIGPGENDIIYHDEFGSAQWYKFGYPTFLSRGLDTQHRLTADPRTSSWKFDGLSLFYNVVWIGAVNALISLVGMRVLRTSRLKE